MSDKDTMKQNENINNVPRLKPEIPKKNNQTCKIGLVCLL